MATPDELALARNIINQLGDFWHERIPSDRWVPVRQATNDELDKWVSELLSDLAREAAKQALLDAAEELHEDILVRMSKRNYPAYGDSGPIPRWLRARAEQIGKDT